MTITAADIYKVTEHSTDIVTHASNLKGQEHVYYAVTVNDHVHTVTDVCVSAKEHGGFTGNVDDLINHVWVFLREVVHLLRDGYGINMGGLLELKLHVGGSLATPDAQPTPEANPVTIRVRQLSGAAKTVEGIHIVNRGLAPVPARIETVTDFKTGAVNDILTPGGPFTLEGVMMKIAGTPAPDDPLGVSFVSEDTPAIEIAVTGNLILNKPTKIIGTTPNLPPGKPLRIRIRTKYTGSGTLLQETRVITSSFTVQRE
jgi:hypothetical protein